MGEKKQVNVGVFMVKCAICETDVPMAQAKETAQTLVMCPICGYIGYAPIPIQMKNEDAKLYHGVVNSPEYIEKRFFDNTCQKNLKNVIDVIRKEPKMEWTGAGIKNILAEYPEFYNATIESIKKAYPE